MSSFSKPQQSAVKHVEDNTDWLSAFHQEIWYYAEPAFREYRSAAAYVKLLREQGL